MLIVLCIFNLLFTVSLGTYCLQVSKNRFQPQLIVYNAGKTSWMVFDWANWRYFSPINSYLHKHKPLKQPAGLPADVYVIVNKTVPKIRFQSTQALKSR